MCPISLKTKVPSLSKNENVMNLKNQPTGAILKPNSETYNFVEVSLSGHNSESSQTRDFCVKPQGRGYGFPLFSFTVYSN